MKYRKILALALSCVMAFSVAACGNSGGKEEQKEDTKTEQDNAGDANAEEEGSDAADGEEAPEASGEMTDITLWTYPIGNWGRFCYGRRSDFQLYCSKSQYQCKCGISGLHQRR